MTSSTLISIALVLVPIGALIGWYGLTDIDRVLTMLVVIGMTLVLVARVLLPACAHSHTAAVRSLGVRGEAVVATVIGQGKAQGIENGIGQLLSNSYSGQ